MKTPVLLLSLALAIFDLSSAEKEKRQTRPLDDVSYETIFSLSKGTFNTPVLARTRTQKSTCVRFWWNKKYFCIRQINGKKVLCFRGKEVLKTSQFDKVKKLKHRLATQYKGVSKPRVQKILSKSSLNQMVNSKFGNKATLVQAVFRYASILPFYIMEYPTSHLIFSRLHLHGLETKP